MIVYEWFNENGVEKDDVLNLADVSPYWESASDFVINNWLKDVDDLSSKQISWMSKILEELEEI